MKKLNTIILILAYLNLNAQFKTKTVSVGLGWASNSINTAIFRKNSLYTFGNLQYISFYNQNGFVVIGKRKFNSKKWQLKTTTLKGNVADAHNSISIIVDGNGYLHIAWNHHNNKLHYCKSVTPGSLILTEEISMTGVNEASVSYPEFYKMPNGNLTFLYRNGASGKGNLVINIYDLKTKQWKQVQSNLIDGENTRNAYWQAFVDNLGTIHISWVWRETPDVASNHDMCYAKSTDGGFTWQKSTGEKYNLPMIAATAEYVCRIPQNSELINQTSMNAGNGGMPIIASYWRDKGDSIPQYHVIYFKNNIWQVQNLGFRKTAFSLSGVGTKRIPISRPQIITWSKNNKQMAALVFRDEERKSKVSIAYNSNIELNNWQITDATNESVGSWEPTYDTALWEKRQILNLFVQFTNQIDGEGKAHLKPQMVKVIKVKL